MTLAEPTTEPTCIFAMIEPFLLNRAIEIPEIGFRGRVVKMDYLPHLDCWNMEFDDGRECEFYISTPFRFVSEDRP